MNRFWNSKTESEWMVYDMRDKSEVIFDPAIRGWERTQK